MTWRHPSITYGAVEPESTVPPPGRRRATGWVATIIGVGLAASALSLALGGGGLALKAAAALVLELRMARPASHHPPTPHGPPRPVGYCCTATSVAPSGARIGTRGHACDACALVDKSYPTKCHYSKRRCQDPECGSGRFCAGTYKGDVPPPPPPGGTTDGVAEVETAIPALTDSDPDAGTPGKSPNNNIAAPGGSQQACSHCYAYCQTITILNTYDWDVDLGGGMSPSECVDAAEAKCGGAYNSLMTGAHCQN